VEQERAELQCVLRSPLFMRSPALAHLLSYVCEKAFAGESDQVKEYSVAVDVFGRDANFDQDSDSIVRVEANRLRKRLAEYYSGEGATHRLRITIPVGQYLPSFEEMAPDRSLTGGSVSATGQTQAAAPERQPSRIVWFVLIPAALVVLLGLLSWLGRGKPRQTTTVRAPAQSVAAPEPVVGLPVGEEVRILAGSNRSYVDRSGKSWGPDVFFTGGATVHSIAQHIWRTQDPTIYRTSRQGDFAYNIPLKPGRYELRLHFAETFYGPEDAGGGGEGSRIMTVTTNGKAVLSDFDVLADAGGGRTADVKVFTDVQPAADGQLHLNFTSVKGGRGMVSAIEIVPGLDGSPRPVRIVARDVPYYSDDSVWWSSDVYFKGGQLRTTEQPASGTDDPELYASERWGNFSYAIPLTPGKYAVTLHFIERSFQAANHGGSAGESGTAAQKRVFSVYCNHKPILRDLNILDEAGAGRPLVKKIAGLEPDAQGKLLLEFIPSHYYATVSAIEVIPQ
jgi:hypothetical protein